MASISRFRRDRFALESGTGWKTISHDAPQRIEFNVMAGRMVEETLFPREYRIDGECVEARFDRQYRSAMRNSPDHLIFLSALVQLQKIVYIYFCNKLGHNYDPLAPEILKIWPTNINVALPKMITSSKDVVHRVVMQEVRALGKQRYFVRTQSDIDGTLRIDGEAMIYVL
jgi:hypothetical protein